MLSNFGPAEGGRETWLYNFLPRLLQRFTQLRLRIHGFRLAGDPDHRGTLIDAVPAKDRDRISIDFVQAKPSRRPNAFAFWTGLRRTARNSAQPRFVIAVGSWVELLAVLRQRRVPPLRQDPVAADNLRRRESASHPARCARAHPPRRRCRSSGEPTC